MTTALTTTNGQPQIQQSLTLKDMIEKRRDLIASVLPKHLTPERLIKLATVAVARVPLLGRCTPLSVVNSVIKAAELGLDCSGTLGSAYLVPFANNKKEKGGWTKVYEAQLIIGYRGLIDLARRSGQIMSIEARVVWSNDEFCYEMGLEPKLVHKPALDKEPGEFRLVYAVAKLRDGASQFEVMTKSEIDAIRKRSKAGDNGPWVSDYPEMARKTVVKRLCKYLPLSVEVSEAIQEDSRAEFVDILDSDDLAPSPAQKLNEMLGETEQATSEKSDESEDVRAEMDEYFAEEAGGGQGEASGPVESQEPAAAGEGELPDLSSYENWKTAAWEQAKAVGVNRITFDNAVKKLLLRHGKVGKGNELSQQWREDHYRAIRDGVFDFNEGRIVER